MKYFTWIFASGNLVVFNKQIFHYIPENVDFFRDPRLPVKI